MDQHRYILEPYKGMNTRYRCPGCSKGKTFSLYIDAETGEYVAPSVGRCNREINCGYHYPPKQYFKDNNYSIDTPQPKQTTKATTIATTIARTPISYIPAESFKASLKEFETNHLIKFLIDHYGIETANKLISKYFIGTSNHWNGASIFWQIDTKGKVRTGKIMLYNPTTGKRVKEPYNHITWEHKAMHQEFNLKQCLYGEHLLKDKTKPIAVVESEKTAVIASVYLPQFIWVATSGASGLSIEKCETLNKHGQLVVLFPDISKPKDSNATTFEKWTKIAKKHLKIFAISDLLERKATETERKQGYDLADYLIKLDYKDFALPKLNPILADPSPIVQPLVEVKSFEPIGKTFFFNNPETY